MTPHRHRLHGPVLDSPADLQMSVDGWVGERVRANESNWLIPAPATNPGMLEMFAHRENLRFVNGPSDLSNPPPLPWAGEFAGKYLISAVQSLRLTGNPDLERVVRNFVAELLATQGTDGSLGMPLAWDLWGQYHVMLGLLRWYEHTADARALAACQRAADLACARYLGHASRIYDDNPPDKNGVTADEKNQAIAHVLALLYQYTGQANYLNLVHDIEFEWTRPTNGNFIENALAGRKFADGRRPRWESLHDVQAIAELYFVTGDVRYRTAFKQIWGNLRELDRHATGGFSSFELAAGNPYDPRYIETCGSVAWMALTIDMLRMTADSTAADELELSLFNAILGAQSPDGRLWTYHTPMGGIPIDKILFADRVGYRLPAYYDLSWQSRERYPQLSCCAANGPRGIGCLSEWAIMRASDAIVINYYGPSTATVAAPDGTVVRLTQETTYPIDGTVRITVNPSNKVFFAIRLRIPAWSATTGLEVNGVRQSCVAGTYCELSREWNPGDVVNLTLDMSVRLEAGTGNAQGLSVAYRGPLLLTYSSDSGQFDPLRPPTLSMTPPPRVTAGPRAALRVTFSSSEGDVTLRDFAGAGQSPAGSLTGRPDSSGVWQFSRSDGTLLAEQIQLLGNGAIHGYSHPNEARWGFDGNVLTFFAASSAASTRFTLRTEQHGRQVLSGISLLDPSVRHILSQVDLGIMCKTWQFRRLPSEIGGQETILLPVVQLLDGGQFDIRTNPNESRWGMEGDTLVFYAASGAASTRFTNIRMQNGRVERWGTFLFDPSITHALTEVDMDVISMTWRFGRRRMHGTFDTLADKLRLLPNHGIDGYWHPNETRWDYGATIDNLVFYSADGAVSTSFNTLRAAGGVMRFEGTFALDHSITHVLEESAPGWAVDSTYVSWMPSKLRSRRGESIAARLLSNLKLLLLTLVSTVNRRRAIR